MGTTKKKSPKSKKLSISDEKQIELELKKLDARKQGKDKTIRILTEQNHQLRQEKQLFLDQNKTPQVTTLKPRLRSGKSESVCFLIASDWHTEEMVKRGDVSGKNEFTLKIAEERIDRFFQGGLRLYQIMARDTYIPTIVLGLLGDFITGNIHEECVETAQLLPADAIHNVQGLIIRGIKFLLANTPKDVDFVIACHSGNHGRMTKKQRHATEAGNSLEAFMYRNIANYFESEKRIKWQIAEGYHSFVRLWDDKFVVRLHHGHNIAYGGGVGGITVPVRKKIAQWNKLEWADLDVFGHFHQFTDAADFICNGSLIGFNAYALSIGADFEQPKQAFFLVNKKHLCKTMVTPILVSK